MCLARMQTGTSNQVVFVNFSTRYHAHRIFAGQNPLLAPALYCCSRVISDDYTSIMEYIPKTRGQPVKLGPHSLVDDLLPPRPMPEVVYQDVAKSLGLLHKQDFVFGDLREGNLLYMPGDLLVDFDGVSRDGGDRYCVCLDPAAKLGVNRWQIMKKEHDDGNLKQLTERLSGGGYLYRKLLFPSPSTAVLRFPRR